MTHLVNNMGMFPTATINAQKISTVSTEMFGPIVTSFHWAELHVFDLHLCTHLFDQRWSLEVELGYYNCHFVSRTIQFPA